MNLLKKLSLLVVAMVGSLPLVSAVFAADAEEGKERVGYNAFLRQLQIGADPSQVEPNLESMPAHSVGNLNYRRGLMSLLGQGGEECNWERAELYFKLVQMDETLSPLLRHNTNMFMEIIEELIDMKKKGRTIQLWGTFAPSGKIIKYFGWASPQGFGDGSVTFHPDEVK